MVVNASIYPPPDSLQEHPMAVARKLRTSWHAKFSLVAAMALPLPMLLLTLGCTVYGEGKPTLATTTSAEQTQRLFWQNVKEQKWQTVQTLLLANVTWRNGTQVLTRDAIVPYLQQLQVKDFIITDVTVKADANDMTVLYTIQLTTGTSAQPVNMHAVAVWQQVPIPPDNAPKQQKKQVDKSAPYLLSVEDLAPTAGQ